MVITRLPGVAHIMYSSMVPVVVIICIPMFILGCVQTKKYIAHFTLSSYNKGQNWNKSPCARMNSYEQMFQPCSVSAKREYLNKHRVYGQLFTTRSTGTTHPQDTSVVVTLYDLGIEFLGTTEVLLVVKNNGAYIC